MNCQQTNGEPKSSSTTIKLNISIDINNINDGALNVIKIIRPEWIVDNIRFKIFTDGCTNKLIGCMHKQAPNDNNDDDDDDDEIVLVRIYGKNTELFIDRKLEITNFQTLSKYGFAPKLLAAFDNGLAYEFSKGTPLTKQDLYCDSVWPLIARKMAEMHRIIKPNGIVEPMLWKKFDNMFKLLPNQFTDPNKQTRREKLLPTMETLHEEYNDLRKQIEIIDSPIVFAHNDLLLGNILVDHIDNQVSFIDYEYAAFNFQAYDIGNHFDEFAGMTDIDYSYYPKKEYQLKWLREYLTHYKNDAIVNDNDVYKLYADVNKFALFAHLFWCLWAYNQAEHSDIDYDFIEFAKLRFNEYLKRKNEFLAL